MNNIQEKPSSMSFKDWTIKQIALNINVSEKTINNIITHQFNALSDNMSTNNTLEISGFGKFIFKKDRAIKKLEKLNHTKNTYMETLTNTETKELRRKNTEVRLVSINKAINYLEIKLKINEIK